MDAKIVAAITAAVTQYLREEQQAAEIASGAPPLVPATAVSNCWGMAGRDDMMRLRNLWQLGVWRK
ncbi:MAG: hypothetical protein HYY29_04135 [Chloroflexi bacterium]|nr:hypothetical protein [Chloroflexota bacterium]